MNKYYDLATWGLRLGPVVPMLLMLIVAVMIIMTMVSSVLMMSTPMGISRVIVGR